jgi:hypothetical protein
MPHDSVSTLTSQALAMDEDESVNGTGAACQGGMARGSDSVGKPSNLAFGAEQHVDPAPMDEDEGIDETGAISQGGIACGSDAVEKPGNLTSGVEPHVNPAAMDEDEGVDGNGAISQGGMPRVSDAVEKLDNPTSGVEQHVDPAPMDEDEGVDETGANSQGGMPRGSVSASTTQNLVENLGNLKSNAPMDEDEDVDKTGAASQGGCPDEDQSTGSAAGDQSGSMIVDGSDSDVHEIEGQRQSFRLKERGDHQTSGKYTDGTSKSNPKPWRGRPKANPRSQPQFKPKPELEKPLGNLNNFGTQLNPIDVDFLQQGSLWDPDGLDAYVSYNRI